MAVNAGELFVRIRPSTAGFKQEAEAGIVGGGTFKRLGELAGIAFGAALIAETVKEMVKGAADVQKQTQGLVSEFGPAAKVIEDFGKTTATSMRLSEQAVATTGNRLGLLFQSLGVGKDAAAQFTVDFEKLVGTAATIRNIDAGPLLQLLPRALAGNARSLLALGVATSAAQIQAIALAHGWAVSGQALTPYAKALAVHEIVLQQLPRLLAQASTHSGDVANQTAKLGVEFSNAKDHLGNGLLPAIGDLVNLLLNVLPPAIHVITTTSHALAAGFDAIKGTLSSLLGPLGGAKNVLEGFIAALAVKKVLDFVAGLGRTRAAAAEQAGAANQATAAYERLTAALEAFVATGTQAAGVETRLAGGFSTAAGAANRRASTAGGVRSAGGGAGAVGAGVATSARAAEGEVNRLRTSITRVGTASRSAATTTASAFRSGFSSMTSVASSATAKVGSSFTGLFTGIKTGAVAMATGVKAAFIEAVPILALTIAITLLIEHFDLVKRVAIGVAKGVLDAWGGVEEGLIGIGKVIGGSLLTDLTLPLRGFLEVAQKVAGISIFGHKLFGGASDAIGGALDALKGVTTSLVSEGLKQTGEGFGKGWQALSKDIGAAIKKKNPLDPKNPDSPAGTIAAGVKDSIPTLEASRKALLDQLNGLGGKGGGSGVSDGVNTLQQDGQSLADAIKQQTKDITDAVESAKSNLNSLAGTLSDSVAQILNAPIKAAQDRLSRLQNLTTLANLRASVILPGNRQLSADPAKALKQLQDLAKHAGATNKAAIQDFIAQYQGAALSVQQDKANLTAETSSRRIADLTNSLNQGKISYATFKKDFLNILKGDHLSYKQAGKLLGSAFFDGFNGQIKDVLTQAKAVTSVNAKGTTGFAGQIIRPLDTLHEDQKKIQDIQRQIGHDQLTVQKQTAASAKKTATESAKQTKLLQQLAAVNANIAAARARNANSNKNKNPGTGTRTSVKNSGTNK